MVESLLFAMLGSIFSILYAIKVEAKDANDQLLRAFVIAKNINSDKYLEEVINGLTDSFRILHNQKNGELLEQAREYLDDCANKISALSQGRIYTTQEEERITVIIKLLKRVRSTVLSSTYVKRWNTKLGLEMFEANKAAIEKGVTIRRIFITDGIDDEIRNIINTHISIGVQVHVVSDQILDGSTDKHVIVFDNFAVTKPTFDKNGIHRGGIMSFVPAEISQSKSSWDRLLLLSKRINSIEELSELVSSGRL